MGRGRPPKPGTAEEKAAARRERVRNNVRALRERRKQEATLAAAAAGAAAASASADPSNNTSIPDVIGNDSAGSSSRHESPGVQHDEDKTSQEPLDSTLVLPNISGRGIFLSSNQSYMEKSIIPSSIDTKSPYSFALLATVREMFLPDSVHLPRDALSTGVRSWDSTQFLWTPCAVWITSAFAQASNHDSSLLKTSLLSIGMLIKSVEYQDRSLRVTSLEMYRRCLQGIRKNLEPIIEGRPEKPKDSVALYLSCHAAAMFELVQNADMSATMRHLRGVSQLICHLGDSCDERGQSMAWLLLQDYRFAEMGLCMKFRYASYSSIARRRFEIVNIDKQQPKEHPTPAQGRGSHNMLVALTDIADDISAVMVKLDSLKIDMTALDTSVNLRRLLQRLDHTWQSFPYLHSQLIKRYGKSFILQGEEDDSLIDGSYRFMNFDIGVAWCYNLMTQLYCLETSIEATTLLVKAEEGTQTDVSTPESKNSSISDETSAESVDEFASLDRLQELRRLHRAICVQLTQCLLYFLQTDKGITGQALAIYPLDTALNMLTVELERLRLDLKHAHLARKGKEEIAMISKDLATVGNAKDFVAKMQDRAKQLGLPSFFEATPSDHTVDGSQHLSRPD